MPTAASGIAGEHAVVRHETYWTMKTNARRAAQETKSVGGFRAITGRAVNAGGMAPRLRATSCC